MKQKMIYISDELFEKLKDEDNASQLIEHTLRDYYKFNTKIQKDDIDEKINEISKEKETELDKLKKIKDDIEKQEKEERESILKADKEKQKLLAYKLEFSDLAKEMGIKQDMTI